MQLKMGKNNYKMVKNPKFRILKEIKTETL